jgi:hypothetical protein
MGSDHFAPPSEGLLDRLPRAPLAFGIKHVRNGPDFHIVITTSMVSLGGALSPTLTSSNHCRRLAPHTVKVDGHPMAPTIT